MILFPTISYLYIYKYKIPENNKVNSVLQYEKN